MPLAFIKNAICSDVIVRIEHPVWSSRSDNKALGHSFLPILDANQVTPRVRLGNGSTVNAFIAPALDLGVKSLRQCCDMFVSGLALLGSRARSRQNKPTDEQQESDGNGGQSDLGKHLFHMIGSTAHDAAASIFERPLESTPKAAT